MSDFGLPDDLELAIGIATWGAVGRANLGVIEASRGPCAVKTPDGSAYMAARFDANDVELRAFTAAAQVIESVVSFCKAREVPAERSRDVFLVGFELAEGVEVLVFNPRTSAFNAFGGGAATFLRTRPADSDWPDLPMGFVAAIDQALQGRSDLA